MKAGKIYWKPIIILVVAGFIFTSILLYKTTNTRCKYFVFIVFDTLRADRMSLYGYEKETTPFLESIKSEILLFQRVEAPSSWTIPSHATMFTGLWPSKHKSQWGRMFLDDKFETLAEILKKNGYYTLGLSSNDFIVKRTGFIQGFDKFKHFNGDRNNRSVKTIDAFRHTIEKTYNSPDNTFIFLNFMDTHIPYNCSKYGKQFGLTGVAPIEFAAPKWATNAGKRRFTDMDKKNHGAAYDGAVRYIDDIAKQIISTLKQKNIYDETLLIITSDHGEGLGYHQEIGHSISVWEEQLSVPLIVHLPGSRRGGEVVIQRTSLKGILPSILDWLNIQRPAGLTNAQSLEPADNNIIIADYRSYFSDHQRGTNVDMAKRHPDLAARTPHMHVLFNDQYKFIATANGDISLYNLKDDPSEQHNLVSEKPVELKQCVSEYNALIEQGYFTPFMEKSSQEEIEETRQRIDVETLKAMGYIQ